MLFLVISVSSELSNLTGRDRRITSRFSNQIEPRPRSSRHQEAVNDDEKPQIIFRKENFRSREKLAKRRKYEDNRYEKTIPHLKSLEAKKSRKNSPLTYLLPETWRWSKNSRAGLLKLKKYQKNKKQRRRIGRKRVQKKIIEKEVKQTTPRPAEQQRRVKSSKSGSSALLEVKFPTKPAFSPILSPQVQFLTNQLQKSHVGETEEILQFAGHPAQNIDLSFLGHPAHNVDLHTGTFSLAVGLY